MIWGTTFALSKFIVPHYLDPFVFTALRTIIGAITLFTFLTFSKQLKNWWFSFKKNIWIYVIIGIMFYSIAYILQYIGIIYTLSMNQAIISNTQIFWVVLFNVIFLKKKPSKKYIPGAILSFLGVSFIILNENFKISQETIVGDVISIVAFMFWGLYTFASKPMNEKENPLYVTTSIILSANFVLIPFLLFRDGISQIQTMGSFEWGIMFYLGIFAVGFTFIFWNFALSDKDIPSENIAIFTMLNPVVGIITAILLIGEILTLRIFLGCIIVVASVFIVNFNFKKGDGKDE